MRNSDTRITSTYKSFYGFEYKKVGNASRLDFFGFVIYRRIGDVKSLFGITWGYDG